LAEGARIAEGSGAAIVDINMGCPARHVTGGQSGSALMRNLAHALTLIEAVVGAVGVPVTLKMRLGWDDVSRNAAELAKTLGLTPAAGAEIVWTKLSAAHLMEAASSGEVSFAASQLGAFIFPRFLPAFDAVATLVHLLALLAATGDRLSKLTAAISPVHIAHEAVVTPWEQKGAVMRTAVERAKGKPVVLVDGVKLPEPDGWTLVLPDPEYPGTHVWAEAATAADRLKTGIAVLREDHTQHSRLLEQVSH